MAREQNGQPDEQTVHFVSARKQRGRPEGPMQPPLTPMIDVTFQLLLFFLLTFTFRQAEGQIPGSLPAAAAALSVDVPETMEIVLRPAPGATTEDRACSYLLRQGEQPIRQTTSPRQLYDLLEAQKQKLGEFGAAEVPVVIRAAKDVPWRYVVDAFNAAIRAEFQKIGFGEALGAPL